MISIFKNCFRFLKTKTQENSFDPWKQIFINILVLFYRWTLNNLFNNLLLLAGSYRKEEFIKYSKTPAAFGYTVNNLHMWNVSPLIQSKLSETFNSNVTFEKWKGILSAISIFQFLKHLFLEEFLKVNRLCMINLSIEEVK